MWIRGLAVIVASVLALAAEAEGRFSGIWEVTLDGRQILWLDLAEGAGAVTGIGTAPQDFGPPAPADVVVLAGQAQGDLLTLVLQLTGNGTAQVQLTALPGIGGSDLNVTLVQDGRIRNALMTWLEGLIDASNTGVTLYGNRPVVDDLCAVTGTRPDTLRFDYLADALAEAVEDGPIEGDVPGFGVWADRFAVRGIGAGGTLNLRAGPGTQHAALAQLPAGASGILVEAGGCTPDLDQIA